MGNDRILKLNYFGVLLMAMKESFMGKKSCKMTKKLCPHSHFPKSTNWLNLDLCRSKFGSQALYLTPLLQTLLNCCFDESDVSLLCQDFTGFVFPFLKDMSFTGPLSSNFF